MELLHVFFLISQLEMWCDFISSIKYRTFGCARRCKKTTCWIDKISNNHVQNLWMVSWNGTSGNISTTIAHVPNCCFECNVDWVILNTAIINMFKHVQKTGEKLQRDACKCNCDTGRTNINYLVICDLQILLKKCYTGAHQKIKNSIFLTITFY